MISFKNLAVVLVLTVVGIFVQLDRGNAVEKDDWQFAVEPYLMATNIGGDASLGRISGATVDVSFSDILEHLEAAFMISAEAYHKSGWGVLIDYGFMKLGADISGPMGGVANAEVRQGVLETFIARKLASSYGDWEFYTGGRWWDNDIDVTVDPAIRPGSINLSADEGWVDPVVGARFGMSLSKKIDLVMRGDVGGFGLSSDFTALVSAGLHYRFTDMIALDVRYKALWVDYETGTSGTSDFFSYTTVTHGPLLGVIFMF